VQKETTFNSLADGGGLVSHKNAHTSKIAIELLPVRWTLG
jgi:hypothetical protein